MGPVEVYINTTVEGWRRYLLRHVPETKPRAFVDDLNQGFVLIVDAGRYGDLRVWARVILTASLNSGFDTVADQIDQHLFQQTEGAQGWLQQEAALSGHAPARVALRA